MLRFSSYTPILDKYAISASAVCAIHCLSLPILLSLFPALGTSIFGQEFIHELLLWLVIPLSVISLSLGCKRHRSWLVGVLGLTGLLVLIFTAVLGHDVLGEVFERVATVSGATLIAAGHLRNYALCRQTSCNH